MIKSYQFLAKQADNSDYIKTILIKDNNLTFCDIIMSKKDDKKYYLLFQRWHCGIGLNDLANYCANTDQITLATNLFGKHGRCYVLQGGLHLLPHAMGASVLNVCLLPQDFQEGYDNFVQTNKKILTPLIKRYGSLNTNPCYTFLYAISGNANVLAWALKNYIDFNISLFAIYRLIMISQTYPQLVSKLQKGGTFIAYNNTNGIKALFKEWNNLRKNKRANDIVNIFNTQQKKLFKENLNDNIIEVLNKFYVLSPVKQQNFVRKVSTLDDINEILRLMNFVISKHFSWSKASLVEYIQNVEDIDCSIVYETETTVLVKTNDYDTVKRLAKTTNWCISKNKSYWNNYLGKGHDNSIQYIIFDFSKPEDDELSIVGFTTTQNIGITHAHSFTNNNLMSKGSARLENRYNTLITKATVDNIYDVLKTNNIPLHLITDFRSIFSEWTEESFLNIINKVLNDAHILYHQNKRIVISTTSNNINVLLGQRYVREHEYNIGYEHLFFADFNREDNSKLLYCIVLPSQYNGQGQTTTALYDEFSFKINKSFNKLINEWGLPYDIICRANNVKNKFLDIIANGSLDEINEMLSNNKIKTLLSSRRNNLQKKALMSELIASVRDYYSLDLITLCQKHDIKVEAFLTVGVVNSILYNLLETFITNVRACNESCVYNDEELEAFKEGKKTNLNIYASNSYWILCLINNLLSIHSSNTELYGIIMKGFGKMLGSFAYMKSASEYLILKVLPYFSFEAFSKENHTMLSTLLNYRLYNIIYDLKITDAALIETIINRCNDKSWNKKFKEKYNLKEQPKATNEKFNFEYYMNYCTTTSSNEYINVNNIDYINAIR